MSVRTSPHRPTATNKTKARSSANWVVGLVIVAVLAAAVVAFISTRGSGTGSSSGQATATTSAGTVATAPVTVSAAPLPQLPDSGTDPAVGKPFPTLSGTNVMTGGPISIPPTGNAKLIFFIAHWCPHCQREVPLLQQWIAQNGMPTGVDLYAVSTGVDPSRGNYPPATWLAREHWTVPTLADSPNSDAAQAAGLTGYPFFVAVGKDGKVVKRFSGERSIAEIEAVIASLRG